MGNQRLSALFEPGNHSRYSILYGPGLEDVYFSADYQEQNIEQAMLEQLKLHGYQRVVFYSPHRSIYFLDHESQRLSSSRIDHAPASQYNQPSSTRMQVLKDGPLQDLVFYQTGQTARSNLPLTKMGDIHAIRLLDTILKDVSDIKSALVIVQAETALRFIDDPRSAAGIIGEWSRLPAANKNICCFLFSAPDYTRLSEIAVSLPVPEISSAILNRNQSLFGYSTLAMIGPPGEDEILQVIGYSHRLYHYQFNPQAVGQLNQWMASEGISLRQWLLRLAEIHSLDLDTAKSQGWFKAVRKPDTRIEDQLNELVGLDDIKRRFLELVDWIRLRGYMSAQNAKIDEPPLLHLIFSGNPGTGKTTLARLVGELYHEVGILSRGHLVEVKGSDLVAGYVGGTAIKTNNVIDQALDGILFIDEAYVLTEQERGGFGQEAVETLLARMENERRRLVVIAAGYPEKMDHFRRSNPGLARRFPEDNCFSFTDYLPSELWQILSQMLSQRGIPIDVREIDLLQSIIQQIYAQRDESFGNAGEMRNLADSIERRRAVRIIRERLSPVTPMLIDDVPAKYRLGLSDSFEQLPMVMKELDELVGLENVKTYLKQQTHRLQFESLK
ncbi:MAG TPA: AAA family ATPase, partial [Anaerolineaceae bacterium]|nr:AAA family ATPase [Anaerolineaceae bacterium]